MEHHPVQCENQLFLWKEHHHFDRDNSRSFDWAMYNGYVELQEGNGFSNYRGIFPEWYSTFFPFAIYNCKFLGYTDIALKVTFNLLIHG